MPRSQVEDTIRQIGDALDGGNQKGYGIGERFRRSESEREISAEVLHFEAGIDYFNPGIQFRSSRLHNHAS